MSFLSRTRIARTLTLLAPHLERGVASFSFYPDYYGIFSATVRDTERLFFIYHCDASIN